LARHQKREYEAYSLQERIRESRILLQNPYAYLNDEGAYEGVLPQSPRLKREYFKIEPEGLLHGRRPGGRYSNREIEGISRELLNEIWVNRNQIWLEDVPIDPLEVLVPSVALRVLGYDFDLSDSLGELSTAGETVEVAGLVDGDEKCVRISRRFRNETRNFTAAHELGHVILHGANGLHRDRPLDGGGVSGPRRRAEIEADKFASFFLMPAKILQVRFLAVFGTQCFSLNDDTAFFLTGDTAARVGGRYSTVRDLSRALASTEQYAGKFFCSLASQFGVSVEAMAIRFEELGLLNK
jgi:Zn-dependent peptidase ImmA (M78 family)